MRPPRGYKGLKCFKVCVCKCFYLLPPRSSFFLNDHHHQYHLANQILCNNCIGKGVPHQVYPPSLASGYLLSCFFLWQGWSGVWLHSFENQLEFVKTCFQKYQCKKAQLWVDIDNSSNLWIFLVCLEEYSSVVKHWGLASNVKGINNSLDERPCCRISLQMFVNPKQEQLGTLQHMG